jgi:hypothetical protein
MRRRRRPLSDGYAAINILARQLAQWQVKDDLRAQGIRLTLIRASEIKARANVLLDDHPELYQVAFERADRMGMIDPLVREYLAEHCRQRIIWHQRPVYKTENAKSGTEIVEEFRDRNGDLRACCLLFCLLIALTGQSPPL